MTQALKMTDSRMIQEHLAVSSRIPLSFKNTLKFDSHLDHITNSLVLTLVGRLTTPDHKDVVHGFLEHPTTPWEFFKQEYAPQWFLKRYPVRMRKFRYAKETHTRMCPHLNFPEPETHIEFLTQGELCKGALSHEVEERMQYDLKTFRMHDRSTWPANDQPYVQL